MNQSDENCDCCNGVPIDFQEEVECCQDDCGTISTSTTTTSDPIDEQTENLSRVENKIAPIVVEFLQNLINPNFHMQELQEFVSSRILISPDSPSRILRELRRKGQIDYNIISRRASHYQFLGFTQEETKKTLRELLSEGGIATLEEYYQTTWWQEFRKNYLMRNEIKCFVCGDTNNIDLHHISYKNLWKEKNCDIVPLRHDIHQFGHELMKEYKIPLIKMHLILKSCWDAFSW